MSINKIFGIGLPKTGTGTLNEALNRLGFKSIHFGSTECDEMRDKLYRGIYKFDLLERYDAVTNACETYYAQLDKVYPGSKFILTVRDKDAWLDSARSHWKWMTDKPNGISHALTIHNHLITFGTYLFNEDRFSYVYDLTIQNANIYFKDRESDLLTLDVTTESNIDRLAAFLGKPTTGEPFAHLHRDGSY